MEIWGEAIAMYFIHLLEVRGYLCLIVTDARSSFLQSGSELFLTGSAVTIRCEFKDGIEGASCVLVYREYGNKTLVVEEYPQNTSFPVTLTVGDDLEKYTFALFGGSNSDIDGRPIVTRKLQVSASPSTQSPTVVPTVTATGNTHDYCSVRLVSLLFTCLCFLSTSQVQLDSSFHTSTDYEYSCWSYCDWSCDGNCERKKYPRHTGMSHDHTGMSHDCDCWSITQSVIPFPVQQERTEPEYPENKKTASPVTILNIKQIEASVQADTSPQQIFVS